MRIGVPKEIKVEEYRVGLTPAGVRELVSHAAILRAPSGLPAARDAARRTARPSLDPLRNSVFPDLAAVPQAH